MNTSSRGHFVELAELKMQELDSYLSDIFGEETIRIEICGGLRTGLFDGPKPSGHSLNPYIPSSFSEIVEIDLRLVVPSTFEIFDPLFLSQLEGKIGFALVGSRMINRWNRLIPAAYLYRYDFLDNSNIGIEWEICLNQEPYFETSSVWDLVFSEEEIEAQRLARRHLRAESVDYKTEFEPLKELQAAEARWRICSSYAADAFRRMNPGMSSEIFSLPLVGTPHVVIAPFVDMWLKGHRGLVPPERPEKILPPRVEKLLSSLPFAPSEPCWVKEVAILQNRLINN